MCGWAWDVFRAHLSDEKSSRAKISSNQRRKSCGMWHMNQGLRVVWRLLIAITLSGCCGHSAASNAIRFSSQRLLWGKKKLHQHRFLIHFNFNPMRTQFPDCGMFSAFSSSHLREHSFLVYISAIDDEEFFSLALFLLVCIVIMPPSEIDQDELKRMRNILCFFFSEKLRRWWVWFFECFSFDEVKWMLEWWDWVSGHDRLEDDHHMRSTHLTSTTINSAV